MTDSRTRSALHVETLEGRVMPAIRLDLVALHEFGHALGLDHHSSSSSIMYRFYNPNYNKNNLASDKAVVPKTGGYNELQVLFSDSRVAANTTSWKDSPDPTPGNGVVNVTYSFMPDGTVLDSGRISNLFSTMNAKFGGSWQSIFSAELNRWAGVSLGNLAFASRSDNGAAFNASGDVQNDSDFGDIRIGGHTFDGANGTLAHTYFPPPNGVTAAGDAHFDSAEDWVAGSGIGLPHGHGEIVLDCGMIIGHDHTLDELGGGAFLVSAPSVDDIVVSNPLTAAPTRQTEVSSLADELPSAVDEMPLQALISFASHHASQPSSGESMLELRLDAF